MKTDSPKIFSVKYWLCDEFFKLGTFLMVMSLAGTLLNIVFRIIMGRLLTSAEYGVIDTMFQCLAIVGVPIAAVKMAVTQYVARATAEENFGLVGEILWRATRRLVIYAAFVILALWATASWLQSFFQLESSMPIYVTGAIFVSAFLWTIWSGGLEGSQRFITVGITGMGGNLARLGVAWSLVALVGAGASGALAGSVASNLIMVAIGAVVLWPLLSKRTRSELNTKPIYRYLWPTMLALWLRGMVGNVDMITVKHFFSPAEAGEYARAAIIGRNIMFLNAAFLLVLFPKVASGAALRESTVSLLLRATSYGLLVSVSGALFCTCFPSVPILIFHGSEYLGISGYVRAVVWALIPFNVVGFVSSYLLGKRDFRFIIFLAPVTVVYLVTLWLYHPTLYAVICVLAGGGIFCLLACVLGVVLSERRPIEHS